MRRAAHGVSTPVYRIHHRGDVFYLRVAPRANMSFAPEVRVHELLRARGVRVPDVVYFAPVDAALGRSVMLTTALKGAPLAQRALDQQTRAVLAAAGRDLAIVNSLPVAGFGPIKRDDEGCTGLSAAWPTQRAALCAEWEEHLTALHGRVFDDHEIAALRRILERYDGWLDGAQARLAHGDIGVAHIYQHDGMYTGLIDFGAIRGADPLYDLGHVRMHEDETAPGPALPSLLAGYADVAPLPPYYARLISFLSLLIAVRSLAQHMRAYPTTFHTHAALRSIRRDITALR